jgi:DNA repair exonuclease SbcCD nuclease subunit
VSVPDPERVATLDLDGLTIEVVSCAYQQGRNPPSNRWKNPLSEVRDPGIRRVGLFHGTIDRIGGIVADGERAFLLDFERLAGWGLDYLALGHIHKRQSFRHGPCLALYPGPIEGTGFSNPGSPILTLVDLSQERATTQEIDAGAPGIRVREVGSIEIDLVRIPDSAALERKILDSVEADRPPPILRVEMKGHADFAWAPSDLTRRLAPRFLHLEIEARDPAFDLGDLESLASQRTLEGIFARKVAERRAASTSPEEDRRWTKVAAAGLRALGRGRG